MRILAYSMSYCWYALRRLWSCLICSKKWSDTALRAPYAVAGVSALVTAMRFWLHKLHVSWAKKGGFADWPFLQLWTDMISALESSLVAHVLCCLSPVLDVGQLS